MCSFQRWGGWGLGGSSLLNREAPGLLASWHYVGPWEGQLCL